MKLMEKSSAVSFIFRCNCRITAFYTILGGVQLKIIVTIFYSTRHWCKCGHLSHAYMKINMSTRGLDQTQQLMQQSVTFPTDCHNVCLQDSPAWAPKSDREQNEPCKSNKLITSGSGKTLFSRSTVPATVFFMHFLYRQRELHNISDKKRKKQIFENFLYQVHFFFFFHFLETSHFCF